MRKPPAPPRSPAAAPPAGRRHPVTAYGQSRRTPSPAQVARWRAELVRLRGADPGDRPEYVAWLTQRGEWMDGIDFTTATDAQVIARTIEGPAPLLPPDHPDRVAVRALIHAGFARMQARELAETAAFSSCDSPWATQPSTGH